MDIKDFLFSSMMPSNDMFGETSDPVWFIVFTIICILLLLLIGIFGKRIFSKDSHKALHKVFKKSSFGLKFFALLYFLLLWFRLETMKFFSMRFWWLIVDIFFVWFVFSKYRYYRKLTRRIERGRKKRGKQ